MPTSNAFSGSTCSLPRSACTIGESRRAPRARSASRAPAQPEPHSTVTRSASFSRPESCSSDPREGTTAGAGSASVPAAGSGRSGAGCRATSPGSTTTETPRLATASRIAISTVRCICSALPISSQ